MKAMEKSIVSLTPTLTETPPIMYSNLLQIQPNENELPMNAFNLENQFQMTSSQGFYGNQIIIMEDTDYSLINQLENGSQNLNPNKSINLTEYCEGLIRKNENYQDYEQVLKENYYNHKYEAKQNIPNLIGNFSDMVDYVEPPIELIENSHSETYSISEHLQLQSMTTHCSRDIIEYPQSQSRPQVQVHLLPYIPQIGLMSESNSDTSSKAAWAVPREEPPPDLISNRNGKYGQTFELMSLDKMNNQFNLPFYCPVKTCRFHLSRFYHRTALVKHCFLTHVYAGRLKGRPCLQEKVLLSKIIPQCEYCKRFFSRKDSLKRHIRQKHD